MTAGTDVEAEARAASERAFGEEFMAMSLERRARALMFELGYKIAIGSRAHAAAAVATVGRDSSGGPRVFVCWNCGDLCSVAHVDEAGAWTCRRPATTATGGA